MNKKLILFCIFICFFIFHETSYGQKEATGISVSPSIAHIDLAQDPPEYVLTYTNGTNAEIDLLLSVQDFTALEDTYQISFLNAKDAKNYKYSLSSWISFENATVRLSPHESKSVKVFIDKNRITKGGHYASILAEIQEPESNKKVTVKAVLSSLLFVRASTGKEIEDGRIDTFKPLQDFIQYPLTYVWRFENNGNVHVIPYGTIEVYDPLNNLIAKEALNQDSLDALPESIRRYETEVNTYQKLLIPGFYTAKLYINFGKTNKKASSVIKFFSEGSFSFVDIAVLIIILSIIAYYIRKRKSKN